MNNKKEQPIALKIIDIKVEAENIKTFKFERKFDVSPGQFILLWIPRLNMKPFGVSHLDNSYFEITVCKAGEFTEKLFEKKVGDYVGIQGPYGKSFSIDGKKRVIIVAGGYGVAPLAFLAEVLNKNNADVTFILGAKTRDSLVYKKRFDNSEIKVIFTTDDGSAGEKGFVTDALKKILTMKDNNFDMIYSCGPEKMMQEVIKISDEYNIDCEVSMERYMKCGFGICGQCCADGSGVRVCKEGPVFDKEFVKTKISEFGLYKREKAGEKHAY